LSKPELNIKRGSQAVCFLLETVIAGVLQIDDGNQ